MRIEQNTLIEELITGTEASLKAIIRLKGLSVEDLNFKHNHREWSILECIEHLNLYGAFYLPEIEKCILQNTSRKEYGTYKSSLIGDYFVNVIKADNPKKMKAPNMMIPEPSHLSAVTIDKFIKQLEKLISLLKQAKKVDLIKAKTPISLTKFITLRLGDTLRFVVYHNERHVLQAEKIKLTVSKREF